MLSKLITTLAYSVIYVSASAGLSGLAFADQSAEATGTAANLERGEQLFALCTQCHATDGGGNSEALAPAIAGLPVWYVQKQLQNL